MEATIERGRVGDEDMVDGEMEMELEVETELEIKK